MAQQNPWSLTYRITIRHPGPEDRSIERAGIGKKRAELGETRPVHRIDRIAVIRVAERDGDKDEPARRQEIETMLRQPTGVDHMLQLVAAQHRLWLVCTKPA